MSAPDGPSAHQYWSTACLHESELNTHEKCKLECKFCGNKCLCPNHEWNKPTVGGKSEV